MPREQNPCSTPGPTSFQLNRSTAQSNMRIPNVHKICIVTLLLYCLCIEASLYPSELDVSGSVVVEQLLRLATFSDHSNPAVTRIVFTPNDMKARTQAPSSCCALTAA